MQKIKIGHRTKFRDRDNFFPQVLFPFRAILRPYFYFRCFDRNLIHSADACFLVMACVSYSRAQLKTLSSLLNTRVFETRTATGRIRFRLFMACSLIILLVNLQTIGLGPGIAFRLGTRWPMSMS